MSESIATLPLAEYVRLLDNDRALKSNQTCIGVFHDPMSWKTLEVINIGKDEAVSQLMKTVESLEKKNSELSSENYRLREATKQSMPQKTKSFFQRLFS